MAVLLGLALGVLLVQVAPAGAAFQRGRAPRPKVRSNTELTLTGLGPGQGVTGYIADTSNPFQPATTPYPSSPPPPGSGWTSQNESFAGVIYGTPIGGGAQLKLYCIDIRTLTRIGYGYALGTWDAANVPNVGYVARVLNDYYPNTNEPAALTDLNQKAAAVQAAIWYFSDKYVLSTADPLHAAVAGIVAAVQTAGPLVEPPPPSLTITPSVASGPVGGVVGPFTVTAGAVGRHRHRGRPRATGPATVNATGGNMYSDAAGTAPIAQGATLSTPTKIWLRSTGPSSVGLSATATATVPTGNVYLYDGNTPNVTAAQKLILAQTATLTSSVSATANFLPPGSLVVTKTIAGPAAGSQGPVVIHVDCSDGVDRPDFTVDAATPAGTTSHTYSDIPFGTICTVTETSNGSVVGTDVVVTGDGQQVTIPSKASATVNITDTYHAIVPPGPPTTGSLVVTKTIAGPLAGDQGTVTIQAVCNGSPLLPVTIAAGTTASSVSQSFNDIPGGSVCTVTETADGSTDTVTATVSGSGQQVTVPAGKAVPVDVTDVYQATPGSLIVTKTFSGSGARQHGRVAILVACGGPVDVFSFVIPARTAVGSVSRSFEGLPAGSRCTVTEVAVGRTARVTVVAIGKRQTVTIPAGGIATVHLADKFSVKAIAVTRPPAVTG